MEAIDLVRQPVKSLELLVQKTEHIPASIWGPEPVLKRPSEWLRKSPSPVPDAYSKFKVGNRPASVARDHFETAKHSDFQQQPIVRTAYSPTALDSRLKQHFECFNSNGLQTSETRYQTQVINQVSSAKQCVANYVNQAITAGTRHCCDDTQYVQAHSQVHWKVPERNHNLQTPQENHQITSDTPQQTNYVYGHQLQESFRGTQYTNKPIRFAQPPQMAKNERLEQERTNTLRNDPCNSNRKVAESMKEQRRVEDMGRPVYRVTEECKVGPVTEKPRISATADILKRPISPEFTTFPNSKSNSLLKLVLSKSLLNYSPQDFEQMRAAVTETYDDSASDEDEDTEEAEDSDTDPCSTSCDSSRAASGSAIFERYWMFENDEAGYSDDSELRQYGTSPVSSGRNSGSEVSASSPFPDSGSPWDDCTG
jgi:hypothetical protein